eukprot:1160831-Pelagomonas_calceolata.AAC.3
MGVRRVTSSAPCLILLARVERSLFKSASGANKFITVLDRMCMKLESRRGGFMGVKTMLFKGLQIVRGLYDPAHI